MRWSSVEDSVKPAASARSGASLDWLGCSTDEGGTPPGRCGDPPVWAETTLADARNAKATTVPTLWQLDMEECVRGIHFDHTGKVIRAGPRLARQSLGVPFSLPVGRPTQPAWTGQVLIHVAGRTKGCFARHSPSLCF